jgi:hypothetical protein
MAGPLRVNNALYSWEDCLFKVDNQQTTPLGNPWNVVALDFAEKRERKVVYTNRRSGRPRGKTRGKYSVEPVTMKLLKAQSMELLAYLQLSAGGLSYGDTQFGLTVQVSTPLVIGSIPITIVLADCTVDGVKDGFEEGVDELLDEVTIGALSCTRNGLKLWSAAELLGGI